MESIYAKWPRVGFYIKQRESMKKIPIFYSFDNNYVVPAAVAIKSLLSEAKPDVFWQMYVLHNDISDKNQELLQNIVKKMGNASLKFRYMEGFLQQEWRQGSFAGKKNKQFTPETITKCFAARFFPEYDKIIYSDVDVVFMDDVSELIAVDLQNKFIAAVRNPFMKIHHKEELGHLSKTNYEKLKDTYFVGGIWVLNLKAIRENNLEVRMMEIVQDNNIDKRWPDQDVMNIACDNKVEYLSLRYISYPYMLERLSKEGFESHFSIAECVESIIYPKILHYAGIKPWNNEPYRKDIWWKVFNELNISKTEIFDRVPLRISWRDKLRYNIWLKLGDKLRKKNLIE